MRNRSITSSAMLRRTTKVLQDGLAQGGANPRFLALRNGNPAATPVLCHTIPAC